MDRSRHRRHRNPGSSGQPTRCVVSGSAATPAVIMTRPPRNVFRKASFNARHLRAPGNFIFFLCISLTHCNLRRVTGGQSHAGERDRGFPSSPFILSRSRQRRVGLDRPRPGRTCRDRRRQAATRRVVATTILSRAFHEEVASRMPA